MKTKFYIIARLTNKDGPQWNLTCEAEEKNFLWFRDVTNNFSISFKENNDTARHEMFTKTDCESEFVRTYLRLDRNQDNLLSKFIENDFN